MAFDGAYGVQLQIFIDLDPPVTSSGEFKPGTYTMVLPNVPAKPLVAEAEPDEIRYFIDAEGFARKEPGNVRIRPVDIPAGAELEDERVDDDSLDTIKWADGVWPPGAYPNPITIVKA